MTFIAALRLNQIAPPCLFDGPINGEVFLAWVRQILVPTLKPGEIVIMDDVSSARERPAIAGSNPGIQTRATFLPMTPRPRPNERVFQTKHLLRKAQARSYDAVLAAIGALLKSYAPQECANYLANCGYGAG